jgi:hypothetical protein
MSASRAYELPAFLHHPQPAQPLSDGERVTVALAHACPGGRGEVCTGRCSRRGLRCRPCRRPGDGRLGREVAGKRREMVVHSASSTMRVPTNIRHLS